MEVSSRNLTPAEITALDDLIRYVIHMFYSDPEIVFMDLLLNSHRELSEEEIAKSLKLQTKQLRKLIQDLSYHTLIKSFTKKDERYENFQKEISESSRDWTKKNYWYIDYAEFIDHVKYRIQKLLDSIESEIPEFQIAEYSCTNCGIKYDLTDVPRLKSSQFHCLNPKCTKRPELKVIDNSTKIQEGNEKKKLLKAQIKVLQDQLEKIKDIQIPSNPFGISFSSDKETQRNSRQKLRMAEEISVNLPSIEPMEEVEDPYLQKYRDIIEKEFERNPKSFEFGDDCTMDDWVA